MSSLIYEKIALISAEIEAIAKNKRNETQKFSYRGIDDFYNMIHPLLAKHGVFSAPEVLDESRELRKSAKGGDINCARLKIKYKFFASDGSFFEATVIGEGMDSGDKASNKAMAIAHKYALMQVFTVPTQDLVDPDAESWDTVGSMPLSIERGTHILDERAVTSTDIKGLAELMAQRKWKKEDAQQTAQLLFGIMDSRLLKKFQLDKLYDLISKTTYDSFIEEFNKLNRG